MRAVLWQADTTLVDLGGFVATGDSEAWAINDAGVVVGYGFTNSQKHAAMWQKGSSGVYKITDLGVIPGGNYSMACGINNKGHIVGYSSTNTTAGTPAVACAWINGVMFDLNKATTNLASYVLSRAYAINDSDRIVGSTYWTETATQQHYPVSQSAKAFRLIPTSKNGISYPKWTVTASLTTARSRHTATSLTNGHVLTVGGYANTGPILLSSAQIFNPYAETWSTTTASLNNARGDHTATLLFDGRVLVAGGWNGSSMTSSEVYSPSANTWTATSGSMGTARLLHTATLLSDGRVLVVGGWDGTPNDPLYTSAEIFNPATGTWSGTGSMTYGRAQHTATLLADGRVLVTGGGNSIAEVYNPSLGTWSTTPAMTYGRYLHTATLLQNGKVLVAGGYSPNSTAELYNPANNTWATTGAMSTDHRHHTATRLPNGTVLVAGGDGPFIDGLTVTELYNPISGTWTTSASLNTGRSSHMATLLPSGKVLAVAGSDGDDTAYSSVEIWQP